MKTKQKKKKEKPIKLNISFDEALKQIVKAKPRKISPR
jgi:hypothetical protein